MVSTCKNPKNQEKIRKIQEKIQKILLKDFLRI